MAYDNETYLRALEASRADINRQVQNTLREVNKQRDHALGQSGQTRSTASNVYQGERSNLSRSLSGASDALSHLGLAGVGNEAFAQGRRDFQDETTGALADWSQAQNLLGQGFREQAAQQRGSVNNISQSLLSDIDSQRADYISRREAEDRAAALQREQMAQAAREAAAARAHAQQLADQQIAAQREMQRMNAQSSERGQLASMAQQIMGAYANDPRAGIDAIMSHPMYAGYDAKSLSKLTGIPLELFGTRALGGPGWLDRFGGGGGGSALGAILGGMAGR